MAVKPLPNKRERVCSGQMRVILYGGEGAAGQKLKQYLYAAGERVQVSNPKTREEAAIALQNHSADCLVLMGKEGHALLMEYGKNPPAATPGILYLKTGEEETPAGADYALPIEASPAGVAELALKMSQLPMPRLAAKKIPQAAELADEMMDAAGMNEELKGVEYAKWCMVRMAVRSCSEPLSTQTIYRQCAKAHQTSPEAVERSLRWAVEKLFTKGRLRGIEQYFGSGADPERGKPTNRVFLQTAAESLRSLLGSGSFGEKQ